MNVGETSRTFPKPGVGVYGLGLNYGVFGKGFTTTDIYGEYEVGVGAPAIFGAGESIAASGNVGISRLRFTDSLNQANATNSAIVGLSEMGRGFGVVGLSLEVGWLMLTEPTTLPVPGRNSETGLPSLPNNLGTRDGVLGASRHGMGIVGINTSGNGVQAHSSTVTGVDGSSIRRRRGRQKQFC